MNELVSYFVEQVIFRLWEVRLMAMGQYWSKNCEKRLLTFLENLNYSSRSTKKGCFGWLLKLPHTAHFNRLPVSNLTVSGTPD